MHDIGVEKYPIEDMDVTLIVEVLYALKNFFLWSETHYIQLTGSKQTEMPKIIPTKTKVRKIFICMNCHIR